MADISHTGSIITITASNTTGGIPYPITCFPNDVDPIEVDDIEIADAEVGTNGDLIAWSKASHIDVTLNIIPATLDHELLSKMHSLNRIEKGSRRAKDVFTLARACPNGEIVTWDKGKMISGTGAPTFQSSGRIKTVSYKFRFAKMSRTPAILAEI